jgi:purine-binding chemotaxis protein CheW
MADSTQALLSKLRRLATDETFLSAYARRRAGDRYDRELLSFVAATETYALDIRQMREIIKLRPITEVPRVPPFVCGVATVRGEIVPVLDLRLRLGLPAGTPTAAARILVCDVDGEPHGLLVDAVRSVLRLRDEQIEATPPVGPAADFLAGIGRVGDDLIILLDLAAVVRFPIEGGR